ncbi:MAG TPA: DUF4147 domain-containing protein [Patescibacteria group bacterium]|jgi:glycerate-2-kinase|nr:DUF4147 domain-containing protein [Patescibacteria group bacterium]
MSKQWIKNKAQLATSDARRMVLDIIEAGYEAIDTESVMKSAISLTDEVLTIKGQSFNLKDYHNTYVIGFGKAACTAAAVIDEILGNNISEGVAIGLSPIACDFIKTYGGTHPHASEENVALSKKILDLSSTLTEKDLVIVIVSGGGSALLCWPIEECKQANKLYEDFLKTGGDILELNTVRKHISLLKGGGLAKHLYPAQVIGLVFSDVPGHHNGVIASGPTFKDESTVKDAQKILDKYKLSGYVLNETPKEDKYFEKVVNIPLVSNIDAVSAMKAKAESLGLKTKILSEEIYDTPEETAQKFFESSEPGLVVLGAGEPKTIVTRKGGGTGGRCQRLGLEALPLLEVDDVFAVFASDGLDNSQAAGVIEDSQTQQLMIDKNLDYKAFEATWDSLGFYSALEDGLIMTGPTGANVSDLMVWYTK